MRPGIMLFSNRVLGRKELGRRNGIYIYIYMRKTAAEKWHIRG